MLSGPTVPESADSPAPPLKLTDLPSVQFREPGLPGNPSCTVDGAPLLVTLTGPTSSSAYRPSTVWLLRPMASLSVAPVTGAASSNCWLSGPPVIDHVWEAPSDIGTRRDGDP